MSDAIQQADDAQAQIDEGERTLDEKSEELETGKQQVEDGQAKLDVSRQQLVDAATRLNEAYNKLMSGEEAYSAATREIEEAGVALRSLVDTVNSERAYQSQLDADLASTTAQLNQQLAEGNTTQEEYDAQLAEAQESHDALVAESNSRIDAACAQVAEELSKQAGQQYPAVVDHENVDDAIAIASDVLARSYDTPIDINGESMTLNEAREKLNNGWNEYNQGLAEYETARTQLDEAESQLQAGRQRVEEGEQQLAEGRDKLEDAKSELESGRAEIDEKTEELEGAKASLAEMAPLTWSISPRAYNGSVMEVLALSDMTHRLSFSMAGLFVIVGMLVSYSAVSRIVHEQIMQIGTKKALGLRGREITLSFILYSTIAVAIGAIVGIVVGVFVVEGIIGTVMAKRFAMGAYPPYFGFPLAVEITLLELTLILGATWIACRSILKRHAVDLLRGEEPPMAKERFYEKWGVWAKLSLFTQTMVSNCVNDKRRVFSTVVGVAGCTALIVTAITLNDDVMESYDRHYRDVFQFDIIVELDPDDDDAAVDAQAAIDAQGLPSVQVRRFGCSVTNSDGSIAVMRVVAPLDAELFSRFYHVTSTAGGDADLGSQGIWVSRAYADHMGVKAGDEIELDVGDGREHKTTIAGFFEYNLTTFEVIIGPESYQDLFGSAPEANALLVDSEGRDFASINHAVGRTAGVKALVDDKHIQGKNFRDFASISRVVVLIYLVLAVLMAAVVLLNLNVMFIDEKKRELIVLMINGFSVHDAKRYIYNDTIVLTVIGIILGLILGGIMGTVTVWSIEPESGHFFKGISWLAMGVAVLGSGVLSIIMSLIALRRIPRFTLTDINRS